MGSLHEHNQSLWIATTADEDPSGSQGLPAAVDVAVLGGGICGLTTARLLAERGARVVVLEAGSLAAGATGNTTAKVTALQATTLSDLRRRVGEEATAVYALANAAAVAQVVALVDADGIDCQLERAAACTYATDAASAEDVEREHAAATAAGLPTRLDDTPELPFPTSTAVWLDDQAQLHPRRYCLGLARRIGELGGQVVDHTRALDIVESDRGCTVTTSAGELHADQVVVATHLPFLDTGGYFARAHPHRSYAVAARTDGERFAGMYISAGSPTRSLRSTTDGWTIVGGEGHKVGHDDDTRLRYEALEGWARDALGLGEVAHRWSAQDYETIDGLPYVGPITSRRDRIYVATGFRKWGFTNSTVAAVILRDLLTDQPNDWATTFDTTRRPPATSIAQLVTENLDVGKRFVGDRLRTIHPRTRKTSRQTRGASAGSEATPWPRTAIQTACSTPSRPTAPTSAAA